MTIKLVESATEPLRQATSQTSFVYARLRSDILMGRYAPSERLKISELAESLDVSPGAVREALSRLAPEQLVVPRDQKGFIVAPLSVEDLEDLTDLRCEVEAIALGRSVERGGGDWEAAVLGAAHRLRRTTSRNGADRALTTDWIELHAAFHAALIGACGSRRLKDLHGQLYQQSERYRGLSAHIETGRDVAAEHQALVDAALDRDSARLVELAVGHLRETTALIINAARLTPD